jgi:hypothetical protein
MTKEKSFTNEAQPIEDYVALWNTRGGPREVLRLRSQTRCAQDDRRSAPGVSSNIFRMNSQTLRVTEEATAAYLLAPSE